MITKEEITWETERNPLRPTVLLVGTIGRRFIATEIPLSYTEDDMNQAKNSIVDSLNGKLEAGVGVRFTYHQEKGTDEVSSSRPEQTT